MDRPDDRVLLSTRITAAAVIVLLVLGLTSLLVFPDRTADLFPWQIKARMTSMALGSGYAAGAYFFVRVLLARRWHTVIYSVTPVLVPLVWFLNRRRGPGVPDDPDAAIPLSAKAVFVAWGAAMLGLSAFL